MPQRNRSTSRRPPRQQRTFADAFANVDAQVVVPEDVQRTANQYALVPPNAVGTVLVPVQVPPVPPEPQVAVEVPVQPVPEQAPPEDIIPPEQEAAAEQHNQGETANNNEITLDTIRDQIVAPATNRLYIGDITHFLKWVMVEENGWLTEYGSTRLAELEVRQENESARAHRSRVGVEMKALLRDAYTNKLLNIDSITPERYMQYITTLQGQGNRRHLSISAYGNKRASLFHLFRLHNRIGYDHSFRVELTNLFKGFYRTIIQERRQRVAVVDGIANERQQENNNNDKTEQGKEPMSVELYKAISGWLLDYGTPDGVFAHCYLVLTWNLACRANNTANIRFSDIVWSTSFDSFGISFAHTKTDQLGEDSKYLRHIYANSYSPLVCPVLALSMYLSSCFNLVQTTDDCLFPGSDQAKRFGSILGVLLKEKQDAVSQMGFLLKDLGTHSIRKGAVSYLASLPGGPPAAAVCIRAGWTMGKVQDIYMRYVASGDQFVGRCLSLLPVLRPEFASSPPHFVEADDVWVELVVASEFPMFSLIVAFGKLKKMCVASILYHRHWIRSTLAINHVVRVTSHCLRTGELLRKVDSNNQLIQVTFPWNDDSAFSGIPPHVGLLQEITQLKNKQSSLVVDFIGELKTVLEQMGVDGGRMSEQNLRNILNNFEEQFITRIGTRFNLQHDDATITAEVQRVENGRVYELHQYDGMYKRLPADWRWPRCGVADLWKMWWIGDSVRNIPPLQRIESRDVKHLDRVPIGEEEMHGRTGSKKGNRRPARKILNDMRFLMKFIQEKVVERGKFEEEITIDSVDRMYKAVADCFDINARDAQKRWITIVNGIRTKKIL
jgi:hypothetical protein